MRAVLIKNREFAQGETIEIIGNKYHHLSKVVRAKENETVLVLNGKGLRGKATIRDMDKRSIKLTLYQVEMTERYREVDMAFGITKKEALEKALASATEMGIRNFIPLETQFSQRFSLKEERAYKIIEGACEQSNNPFLLNYTTPIGILSLDLSGYDEVFLLTLHTDLAPTKEKRKVEKNSKCLMLIGPEGGFSRNEVEHLIKSCPEVKVAHFDSPILRAETALVYARGYLEALFATARD